MREFHNDTNPFKCPCGKDFKKGCERTRHQNSGKCTKFIRHGQPITSDSVPFISKRFLDDDQKQKIAEIAIEAKEKEPDLSFQTISEKVEHSMGLVIQAQRIRLIYKRALERRK